MTQEKVFQMKLQTVYPLLVAKAEKKGRTRAEVDQVTCWLTGYSREKLASLVESQITYGDFFRNAPAPNPHRKEITGSVCGVRVETMDDPLMQEESPGKGAAEVGRRYSRHSAAWTLRGMPLLI